MSWSNFDLRDVSEKLRQFNNSPVNGAENA